MKINLSGHHVDVTDSVKEYVNEKLSKLATHFPTLILVDVIIAKEHGDYKVEMCTKYEGTLISASSSDAVMYPVIMATVKKLDAALKHRKGQLKADLHEKPHCTTAPIAHEIIQEMQLS